MIKNVLTLLLAASILGLMILSHPSRGAPAGGGITIVFVNVSSTHLPAQSPPYAKMAVESADVDGDSDLDLILAREFGTNLLYINDGTGHFTNESAARLPQVVHDSEDIGIADFDGVDGLDIIFVSEDDQVNEFYLNDGNGFFMDASDHITTTGISNAVAVTLINNDPFPDILFGNEGQNIAYINNGNGYFFDETATRLPVDTRTTQDLTLGDIDADTDLDLIVGNENGNRILLNTGTGVFTDATTTHFPPPPIGEETRGVDLGDVDGDTDLDLFLSNVTFGQGHPNGNRLLLNNGTGVFTDATTTHIPAHFFNTVDSDFYDLNGDNTLDLVLTNAFGGNYQIYLNDGNGYFIDVSAGLLPPGIAGNGIDIEIADFNGDTLPDIYFTKPTIPAPIIFSSDI